MIQLFFYIKIILKKQKTLATYINTRTKRIFKLTKPAQKRGRKRKTLKAREKKFMLEMFHNNHTIDEITDHFYCDEEMAIEYLNSKGCFFEPDPIFDEENNKLLRNDPLASRLHAETMNIVAREHILARTEQAKAGIDYQLRKAIDLTNARIVVLPNGREVSVDPLKVFYNDDGQEVYKFSFQDEKIICPVFPDTKSQALGLKLLNEISGYKEATKYSLLANMRTLKEVESIELEETEEKENEKFEIVFPTRQKL